MWNYTINDQEVKLKSGEERFLAVYRQSKSNRFDGYDPQDEEQLKNMIESDDTVLLLKIKVENKER